MVLQGGKFSLQFTEQVGVRTLGGGHQVAAGSLVTASTELVREEGDQFLNGYYLHIYVLTELLEIFHLF
jgi:hypothetical protein